MVCIRWSLPLLLLCLALAEAPAQGVLLPSPYGGGYFAGGAQVGVVRVRRHRGLVLSLGAFGVRGYDVGPVLFGPVPRGPVVYVLAPPTVVVRQRVFLDDLPPMRDRRIETGEPPEVPDLDEGRPPRIMPPAEPPPKKEAPPPPPPPKKEAPRPPERRAPKIVELPRPPVPEDDRSPYDRLIDQGREAFRALEYGRAAMRFRRASAVEPARPLAHFLLAQALFAQGKYHEASDAIHAGMALAPDWPTSTFQPLELYGPHVADYSAHLETLEAVLARHPRDHVLLFLSAYHLWFDGRKEEAAHLFRRALRGAEAPGVIDRFLRALPAAPDL